MDQTFCARLRAQRERQDVALATIAEETKINLALLEGLERGDLSRWPGGLFRRAYLRAYAQKIGLEPESVVREFLELFPDPIDRSSPLAVLAENAPVAKGPRTRLGFLLAGLAGMRPQPREDAPKTPGETEQFLFVEEMLPERLTRAVQSAPGPAMEEAFVSPPAAEQRIGLALEDEEPEALEQFLGVAADRSDRGDNRALERNVISTARLVSRVACARNEHDVTAALEETVRIVDAQGAILWMWDPDRAALCPMLAHGYKDELLMRLPEVDRHTDNAIAAAFRSAQKKVVHGVGRATGACVVPLVTTAGCVGVLALEFANGAEQHELAQALLLIVAAQLSTLFCAAHAIEEAWPQHGSLVAS